ncbi:MAG: ATP synthase F1 subunit gamma [bacterium]|nr:ATP synthase F1 subunit gamma [bacterium]
MPNLRDIRKRIEASISISKITMTMEKIATVRMTRMMQRMESAKAYNTMLLDMAEDFFLSLLGEDISPELGSISRRKNIKTAGVVFIASNQGLCAGFNVALNHELERLEERLRESKVKLRYYSAGKKAIQYLERCQLPIEYSLDNLTDRFTYAQIVELGHRLMQDLNLGKIDDLYLVYTHYVASATYRVVAEHLSPWEEFLKRIKEEKSAKARPILCHPNSAELMDALLPELIINRIYKALLESMVCEQIARRLAMKQATDAAEDKIEELRIMYHTLRQAKITKEVNEMMGTVLALQRD